jgi:hypothetical protein
VKVSSALLADTPREHKPSALFCARSRQRTNVFITKWSSQPQKKASPLAIWLGGSLLPFTAVRLGLRDKAAQLRGDGLMFSKNS